MSSVYAKTLIGAQQFQCTITVSQIEIFALTQYTLTMQKAKPDQNKLEDIYSMSVPHDKEGHFISKFICIFSFTIHTLAPECSPQGACRIRSFPEAPTQQASSWHCADSNPWVFKYYQITVQCAGTSWAFRFRDLLELLFTNTFHIYQIHHPLKQESILLWKDHETFEDQKKSPMTVLLKIFWPKAFHGTWNGCMSKRSNYITERKASSIASWQYNVYQQSKWTTPTLRHKHSL